MESKWFIENGAKVPKKLCEIWGHCIQNPELISFEILSMEVMEQNTYSWEAIASTPIFFYGLKVSKDTTRRFLFEQLDDLIAEMTAIYFNDNQKSENDLWNSFLNREISREWLPKSLKACYQEIDYFGRIIQHGPPQEQEYAVSIYGNLMRFTNGDEKIRRLVVNHLTRQEKENLEFPDNPNQLKLF